MKGSLLATFIRFLLGFIITVVNLLKLLLIWPDLIIGNKYAADELLKQLTASNDPEERVSLKLESMGHDFLVGFYQLAWGFVLVTVTGTLIMPYGFGQPWLDAFKWPMLIAFPGTWVVWWVGDKIHL